MKLLEYEAKHVLKQYDVAVPSSVLIESTDDTPALPTVLKSQVPVGGRGKAGGIRIITETDDLDPTIQNLLKLSIKGFTPKTLLAEELLDIAGEFYLSILINRDQAAVELLAHKNGGVEVEENDSESFLRTTIDTGNSLSVGEQLAEFYDLPTQTFALQGLIANLFTCFKEGDATLIEINPLILTKQGTLVAGDCKMELDDAAAFRHTDWSFEQRSADVNFVTVNENGLVATIANGAGLGMATVDAVAEAELSPANFLDIGGGATSNSVLAAFEKIMEYPNVKAIVINIFAGITKCDEVARAIITAKQQITNLPPLSIRLAGTNFEQAVELLAKEDIGTYETLEECLTATKKEIYE